MRIEENNNKIINGLWVGDKLSRIELLTLNSFIKNGHEFHLWVYDKLLTEVPEGVVLSDANSIVPREKIFRYKNKNQFGHGKGSLGGFSDIFRYKLLYERGGWWVDMDVCCLKPFDFESPYVFRTHHNLRMVGNIMKCPQKSELMNDCYNEAIMEVTEENTNWHKPIEILNKHVEMNGLTNYIYEISNHDNWNEVRKLITKNQPIPETWYAIHWANEMWRSMGLNKDFYYRRSTLGSLYFKYGVIGEHHSIREKARFFIKTLSLLRFRMVWQYMLNFIRYRFYYGFIIKIHYLIISKFYHKVIVHLFYKIFCNRYVKRVYRRFKF